MARRPIVPQPITSVRLETPRPDLRPDAADDVRRPWPWQQEAIARLKDADLRMLTAPTGSGKSTVVEALGLHDLARGMKVIVAVPQLSIASGYERELLDVDGEQREWNPGIRVDSARIRRIVRFLLEPAAPDEAARTLVCTQLALAMAAMHPDVVAAANPWSDVSLFLDEAHHSLTADEGASRHDGCRVQPNALGQIVTRYVGDNGAPLMLITATWMRTDEGAIVPASALESFAHYHRGFDEHMKDMRHVRALEIRFVVGAATECLEALFKERHPADMKTVVWHPAPGSDLLRQQGGKHGALAKYRRTTGWRPRRKGNWDVHEFEKREFTALELVDDGRHRRASMRRLLEGINEQKRAARERGDVSLMRSETPDVVWALNLLREGSDYPALARGILMAPRGAMLDTLQMLGRLLRDYPGKGLVEFDVVLPTDGPAVTPTASQVSNYLRYMVASLLVAWQFMGFGAGDGTSTDEERRELAALERADVQERLASDIVDAAIWIAETGLTPEEEVERIADCVMDRGGPASFGNKGLVKHRLRQMLLGRMGGGAAELGTFEMEETLVGRLRSFVGRFGYDDLRKLREGLGRVGLLTREQIQRAMLQYHSEHGRWPTIKSPGAVPGIGGTWMSIQVALTQGGRGLSGGSSLLKERIALTGEGPARPDTVEGVVDAILAFHREEGEWPNALAARNRRMAGLGCSWSSFSRDRFPKLRQDGRIPSHKFPSMLVQEAKNRLAGISGSYSNEPLTRQSVVDAILAHRHQYGAWPNTAAERTRKIAGLGCSWRVFRDFRFQAMKRDGRVPGSWGPATLVREAKEKWRLAQLDSEQPDSLG